jgi:hypothetical protein
MRRGALALLLASVTLAGAQASSPSSAEDKTGDPGDEPSRWETAPPVRQAIAAALSYHEEAHADTPVALDPDIRVRDTTTGAFTRADVEQRAVLYQIGTQACGFPDLGLAILEGDRLVANFAHSLLAESVTTLRDPDGSGRDPLALEGGFGMGGQYTRGITIAAFGDYGLAALGYVDSYEDVCGAGIEGVEGPTRARISVVPGSGLVIERERKATCDSETWEPLGGPEPLELDPPDENPFEDITQRKP